MSDDSLNLRDILRSMGQLIFFVFPLTDRGLEAGSSMAWKIGAGHLGRAVLCQHAIVALQPIDI